MKLIRNLLATITVLAALAAGAELALLNAPEQWGLPPSIAATGRDLLKQAGADSKVAIFSIGVGLFLSALLTVLLTFFPRRRKLEIRVDLDGGSVIMSEHATKKYIEVALAEYPEIAVRRIRLQPTRRGVAVDIQAELKTQRNVPDVEQTVITRVHVALVKELGIEKVSGVRVEIQEFLATKAAPAATAAAASAPSRAVASAAATSSPAALADQRKVDRLAASAAQVPFAAPKATAEPAAAEPSKASTDPSADSK